MTQMAPMRMPNETSILDPVRVLCVLCGRFAFADEPVSYSRDVVPFLEEHCIACHDDGFETSDLALHDLDAMLKGGRRGPAIVPGKGGESPLVQFMTGKKQPQMPPKTSIPLDQIDVIKRWIDQGAKVDDAGRARRQSRDRPASSPPRRPPRSPPTRLRPSRAWRISPDGKILAAAGYKEVVLVDPATRQDEAAPRRVPRAGHVRRVLARREAPRRGRGDRRDGRARSGSGPPSRGPR